MMNIFYILLGIIGLGFLVFIHELGHYIVARRVGMKVEVFSIGFGKPFFTFIFQGVRWQICYLFFGGFVKIAGMEKEGNVELHQIKDGFFGAKPINRIRVAIAGPLVNILFAFVAFTGIFLLGGRLKPFAEFTKIVGFVDPKSQSYQEGLRVGDTVSSIDQHPYKGFHDLIYSSVLAKKRIYIEGDHVNYQTGNHIPFKLDVPLYPHPQASNDFQTFGLLSPAMFLVYEPFPDGRNNPIPKGSPMYSSGILPEDRIVWVDGENIFSVPQLQSIVNRATSLITVQRDHQISHFRVPRIAVKDLRLSNEQKAELIDWQHEIGLKEDIKDVFFIPYDMDSHCAILDSLAYIDDEAKQRPFMTSPSNSASILDQPLKRGDQILAVDGVPIESSFQFLREFQQKKVQIIVDRSHSYVKGMNWKNQDEMFLNSVNWKDLQDLTAKIGISKVNQVGSLYRLNPVAPVPQKDFPRSEKKQMVVNARNEAILKKIENIVDVKEKQKAQDNFETFQNRLVLGIALQDKEVVYNPAPWQLFWQVVTEMFRTIGALFSGLLHPKWMSGPVGFVQVMQHGWSLGVKEALYWLGMISLGLGLTNLLPIPVLDGGYICFALWEIITGKPIKAKVMERMIVPFVVLMILFFVFVTYHDVMRVFQRIF